MNFQILHLLVSKLNRDDTYATSVYCKFMVLSYAGRLMVQCSIHGNCESTTLAFIIQQLVLPEILDKTKNFQTILFPESAGARTLWASWPQIPCQMSYLPNDRDFAHIENARRVLESMYLNTGSWWYVRHCRSNGCFQVFGFQYTQMLIRSLISKAVWMNFLDKVKIPLVS